MPPSVRTVDLELQTRVDEIDAILEMVENLEHLESVKLGTETAPWTDLSDFPNVAAHLTWGPLDISAITKLAAMPGVRIMELYLIDEDGSFNLARGTCRRLPSFRVS